MNIAIIGLGKIGLPLAIYFAHRGNQVIGSDKNLATVNLINQGIEPFPEEENLQEWLHHSVVSGKMKAVQDNLLATSQSNVVLVAVPLIVDQFGNPDFSILDSVTQDIALGLKPGHLVIYETTLPIGTTRERFLPMLEKLSGLLVGVDFNLAFSPERVLTGRVFKDLERYPKIVGGVTQSCTNAASQFYEKVIEFENRKDLPRPNGVWAMDSSDSAEFVKIAETTYRDVNIGLANQFAMFAHSKGLGIHEIILAANSQPYSHIHDPGISVGGHCIPVYPQFYLHSHSDATIVRAARDTNSGMPRHYVDQLELILGTLHERDILILGATYREKVKETIFSGSIELVRLLRERGANVFVADPLMTNSELLELGFNPEYQIDRIEALVLHTKHQSFKEINFSKFANLKTVIDGRNFFESGFFPTDVINFK
jgi:UDP-N-acetyl-D-glucosamine dehydrogenase